MSDMWCKVKDRGFGTFVCDAVRMQLYGSDLNRTCEVSEKCKRIYRSHASLVANNLSMAAISKRWPLVHMPYIYGACFITETCSVSQTCQ